MVPLSAKVRFTETDEIAIRHILHYLPDTDRFMVAPRSAGVRRPEFDVVDFPDRYFGSIARHTRMMLSSDFYERFLDYDFILFHHLDALVLDSDIHRWCDLGYDFIGAPRFAERADRPTVVGNGGFALRRVRSFLDVIRSQEYAVDPDEYYRRLTHGRAWPIRLAYRPLRMLKRLRRFNGFQREVSHIFADGVPFEDIFMSQNARKYSPSFEFAPTNVALDFAFDENPSLCYELNGNRLPFGCHAWYKQDRKFWEPYLVKS